MFKLLGHMARAAVALAWENRFTLFGKAIGSANKRYIYPKLKMHNGSPFATVRAYKALKPIWQRAIHAPNEGIVPLPAIDRPITTKYVIQRHFAKRAGEHFDLRMMINGRGVSFAIPKHRMPNKGENLLAVLQPDHIEEYFDFEGDIPDGLKGAGRVEVFASGEVDVISCGPEKLVFEIPDGPVSGRYVLINTSDTNFLLRAFPVQAEQAVKPKIHLLGKRDEDYTSKAIKAFEKDLVMEEKVDGACAGWSIDKDGRVELTSPRLSKITGKPIRYTHKLPRLRKDLAGFPKCSGEAELWHKRGPNFVAAVLNSSPERARYLQRVHGPVRAKLLNIHEEEPYGTRYNHLRDMAREAGPTVDYMRQCAPKSADEAVRFAEWCRTNPNTPRDGFVGKDPEAVSVDWVKGKPTDSIDVPIIGFKEGTGKYAGTLGSLQVSRGGEHSVTLGTGFTDSQRDWIWAHRDELDGEIVKARFHERSGTDLVDTGGRFDGFHESKSEVGLKMYAEALADGDPSCSSSNMLYRLKSAVGWRRS